jgi:hypothetical protein
MLDYILNGNAHGPVAAQMLQSNFDVGLLRPFVGKDGRSYVTLNQGFGSDGKIQYKNMVRNAAATLRKEEWVHLDDAVMRAATPRLKAWADLEQANPYVIPNGWGKTVLESQSMSDISAAQMSMDGIVRGDNDRPLFDTVGLPLPIVHKDFEMSARQIQTSRNAGEGLDTNNATLAGVKVAEMIEQLTIGVATGMTFGGYTSYGYTNWGPRLTYSITAPTTGGWTPDTLIDDVLAMRDLSIARYYYGPWKLYMGLGWTARLDADYSALKGDLTLRERLLKLEGITGVQTLDFLTGYQALLVQMTPEVCRAVIAMRPQTIQWEEMGGMIVKLKVMAVMVPQLRADYNGNTGLVHAS